MTHSQGRSLGVVGGRCPQHLRASGETAAPNKCKISSRYVMHQIPRGYNAVLSIPTDQLLFQRVVEQSIIALQVTDWGLPTQYLFVTRHNRKIIVTDRRGRGSLSYIDRVCFLFFYFFFPHKWRDWNFILRPRVLVPISGPEKEKGVEVQRERARFQGEEKRSLSPQHFFPLFVPLQYPCWDEGGADWRNEKEGKGVVAATNIPGMDYGAGPQPLQPRSRKFLESAPAPRSCSCDSSLMLSRRQSSLRQTLGSETVPHGVTSCQCYTSVVMCQW